MLYIQIVSNYQYQYVEIKRHSFLLFKLIMFIQTSNPLIILCNYVALQASLKKRRRRLKKKKKNLCFRLPDPA